MGCKRTASYFRHQDIEIHLPHPPAQRATMSLDQNNLRSTQNWQAILSVSPHFERDMNNTRNSSAVYGECQYFKKTS